MMAFELDQGYGFFRLFIVFTRNIGYSSIKMRKPDSICCRVLSVLAVGILLGSCESYGPFHPNTAAEPLNSIRGPSDGRYKLAFIEFGDQGSALDTFSTSSGPQRHP